MNLRRTVLPFLVTTLVAAACSSPVTPPPAVTSTPVKSLPIPLEELVPQQTPAQETASTIDGIVTGTPQFSATHRDEIIYVVGGKVLWQTSIASGIEDYSLQATGGQLKLSKDTFIGEQVFVDPKYRQVIAVGRDDKFFPAKISFLNIKTGKEESSVWHAGHIKSVVLVYGVITGYTPYGLGQLAPIYNDFIAFTALNNSSELIREAEAQTGARVAYVPVIGLLSRSANGIKLVASKPVALLEGQALNLHRTAPYGTKLSFDLQIGPETRQVTVELATLLK